ncbi:MAG: LysR family transcriptional regulator [Pseudomonadota bacterium]
MRAMRAFAAAARRLSFRQAAEDLYLTASAISHQVKQLETEFGVALFRRLPRNLELTAAGRQFADDLQPVLDQLDEVVSRHCKLSVTDEVSIAVRPLFANELLMPSLGHFLETHPDFRISVETSEDVDADNAACDASFRLFSHPPAKGEWDRLFAVSLMPVGTVDLYDRISIVSGRIRDPIPLVVHNRRPNAWRDWQKASGLKLPKNCPVIKVNSSLSVARAAEKGLGAALLPADLIETSLLSGAFVPLFDQVLESGEAFYFGSDQALRKDKPFADFRAWVLQQFAVDT